MALKWADLSQNNRTHNAIQNGTVVHSPVQYAFPTGDDVARPVSTVLADGTLYSSFDLDQGPYSVLS